MIITINISKEEIELIESGNVEAATAAAELYRYTLLQAAMTAKNTGLSSEDGPTNYFVVSPPYNVKGKAETALCVPHPRDFPTAGTFDMNEAANKEKGIVRPEVKTDIPNAFKNIMWNEDGVSNED